MFLYAMKAIMQAAIAARPHVFGYVTPRGENDSLLEVWNDDTGSDKTFVVTPTGLSGTAVDGLRTWIGAKARKSADQTLTNVVPAKILFQTEDKDTHDAFASSTYTVPIAGEWEVSGSIHWGAGAANVRQVYLYKNGSLHRFAQEAPASSQAAIAPFFFTVSCIASDTLEIWGYQNSGGDISVLQVNNGTVVTYKLAGL